MGYSLSMPTKSTKARDQMLAFLREHHRPFGLILDEAGYDPGYDYEYNPHMDPTRFILVGDELAYGPGASKIGFNFCTSSRWMSMGYFAGSSADTLCRWMALKVGRRRTFKTLLSYPQAFPYFTYDSKAIPVLTAADIKGWEEPMLEIAQCNYLCDEVGFRKDSLREYVVDSTQLAQLVLIDEVILREIQRLNALWESK